MTMADTKIQWADKVWNPITGCTPIGLGCAHCYAKRAAESPRLRGRFGYDAEDPFRVTFHTDRLEEPLHWRKPARIFVCSMGDLFHDEVTFEMRTRIFDVMHAAPRHTYVVLTKRTERMSEQWRALDGPCAGHIWAGCSVSSNFDLKAHLPALMATPAPRRFLSIEPLLGPIDLIPATGPVSLNWVDWIIAGGETGVGARPCDLAWFRRLAADTRKKRVPFFIKQLGQNLHGDWLAPNVPTYTLSHLVAGRFVSETKVSRHANGRWRLRMKTGNWPDEWPEDLRGCREFPVFQ
jgi:protein gp37